MLYIEIAIILALIVLNGIFAMSELAIVSSKKVHLRRLADEGSKAAAQSLDFAEDTGKFLPTVQVGITLIGILAGAFGGATLADHLTDYLLQFGLAHDTAEFIAVGLIVVVITYITLIIGELVPKELALRNPEKFAMIVAPVIYAVSKIAWPAVWILNKSCACVLRLIRAGDKPESTVTQEEVTAMIAEGTQHGIFSKKEKEMLAGVMLLADKPIRVFMIPRIDVVSFDCDASEDKVKAALTEYGYSRFPVRPHDDEHHVLGIVETRDILTALLMDKPLHLRALVKEIQVFPESTSAIKVMEYLRKAPTHVAIIVDEHGSFEGIVTLIDLFAAISGEFYEHGQEAEIVKRDDGSWLIDGGTLIDRVFKKIGLRGKLEDDSFHTLAGFILHRFHTIPKAGDIFDYKNYSFEVIDMDGYRIDKVLVTKKERIKKIKKSQGK
ncbi:MAG: hemolysin family protein [Alphaproteobacteria bacterium]